jgi:hypothetical protein
VRVNFIATVATVAVIADVYSPEPYYSLYS